MKSKEPSYLVTKFFTGGLLKGLSVTEETRVKFEEGFRCPKPAGGSPYVITKVVPMHLLAQISERL